jgi:cytochrome c-type biogenesis protein CcmE
MGDAKANRWLKVLAFVVTAAFISCLIPEPEGPPPALAIAHLPAKRAEASGRDVNIEGLLVYGSLRRDPQTCITEFVLADERDFRATVPVRYAGCAVLEALREVPGQPPEIGAIGRLRADGRFEARELFGKSYLRFEMNQPSPAPGAPLVKLKGFERDPPIDIAKALRGSHAVPSGSTSHDTFSP